MLKKKVLKTIQSGSNLPHLIDSDSDDSNDSKPELEMRSPDRLIASPLYSVAGAQSECLSQVDMIRSNTLGPTLTALPADVTQPSVSGRPKQSRVVQVFHSSCYDRIIEEQARKADDIVECSRKGCETRWVCDLSCL